MRFFLQLVALQKKIHQKIYFFLSKFCEANLPLAPDAIDFTRERTSVYRIEWPRHP